MVVAYPDHISNNPEAVVHPQAGYDETGSIRLPTWEYGQAETYTRAPWERCQLDIEVDLLDHMLLTFPWAHPSMAHGLLRMAEEGKLSTSQPMRLDYQEIVDAFGHAIYNQLMAPGRSLTLDLTPTHPMPESPWNYQMRM